MRRIRRSRHNKSKVIYVVFVCFVTALVFFFSVGYAVYSDRLLVGGRAYITSVVEGYSCHVQNIEGEILEGLSIKNTIWNNQHGSVEVVLDNVSQEELEHFTILLEFPEEWTVTGGWGGSYVEKEGFIVITPAAYNARIAAGTTFSHTITYQHEPDDSFTGFTKDQVIALKDEEGTTYDCENRNWLINGEISGSDDGFDETINNLLLNHLSVNGYSIRPVFSPTTVEYSVNVFGPISEVDIVATPQEVTNTVTGTGTVTLQEGKNYFDIVVSNARGLTKTYKLTIGRYSEGAGPGETLNVDGIILSYKDNYTSGREHQFEIKIENTKDVDVTNWVLAVYVGEDAEVTSIWSNVQYEFEQSTGLLEFLFNAATTNPDWEVLNAGETIQLNGLILSDEIPRFITISYD